MFESDQRKEILEDIARFRLFDDTFMSAVFDGQNAETQLLIRTIMGRDDITVVKSKAQHSISNPYGHEVRLDVIAFDEDGKAYHFEVQRGYKGASVRRARFTAALVDTTLLAKGADYSLLPDRYTIFITEHDFFGMGCAMYHAENRIEEINNAPLGDGGHIIYVNGEYRNLETPIGQLMHDFSCVNPNDIINNLLRDRVRHLKDAEGGKGNMCEIMENLMEKKSREDRIKSAEKLIVAGQNTLETIADSLDLPLDLVKKLANSKKESKTGAV